MANKKLTDYPISELQDAIWEIKNEQYVKDMSETMKYNFGLSNADFGSLINASNDIDWSSVASDPWFVIYENEDCEIYGTSAENVDGVKELIEENVSMGYVTLYVLKEGKMKNFSEQIIIKIG